MLLDDRTKAIISAQWRMMLNYYPRGSRRANLFTWSFMGLWYALVIFGAYLLATAIPEIRTLNSVRKLMTAGAVLALLYWQIIPLALVSSGMSLQLKRLIVYPIPIKHLFAIEVALRVSTGIEPLILMVGAAAGLWAHPLVPWWAPLILVLFAVWNMVVSAGLRDLFMRLLARRGIRELVVIGFVMLTALPQVLLSSLPVAKLRALEKSFGNLPTVPLPLPWTITGRFAAGMGSWLDVVWMLAWVAAGLWFGMSQFRRNIDFDADQVRSDERESQKLARTGLWDQILRLPSRLLPDPMGMLVEKEFRFLSRAPRFRLVFFMGFTFGLAIWLPMMFGRRGGGGGGFFSDNFLVVLSLYAALLMGEVLFWNQFGFDRQATQAYFAMPVSFRRVMLAKNITAVVMLLAEIGMVALAVFVLRLPITFEKLAESFAVTMLFCLFLLSAGNLASVRYPRSVNPSQAWRNNSAAKVQGLLLLLYPAILVPVSLAYLARFAFETQAAFYTVLGACFLVALMTYGVALDSALEIAEKEKERIIESLSSGDSLVA